MGRIRWGKSATNVRREVQLNSCSAGRWHWPKGIQGPELSLKDTRHYLIAYLVRAAILRRRQFFKMLKAVLAEQIREQKQRNRHFRNSQSGRN